MYVMINAELSNPPSKVISFREVTMLINLALSVPILIEVEMEYVDCYYSWLKKLGGMDFVEDFVSPGTEKGCRIDYDDRFPNTVVVVPKITEENVVSIAVSVKSFFGSLGI